MGPNFEGQVDVDADVGPERLGGASARLAGGRIVRRRRPRRRRSVRARSPSSIVQERRFHDLGRPFLEIDDDVRVEGGHVVAIASKLAYFRVDLISGFSGAASMSSDERREPFPHGYRVTMTPRAYHESQIVAGPDVEQGADPRRSVNWFFYS